MNCPVCRSEAPEGASECALCHAVLAAAPKAPAASPAPAAQAEFEVIAPPPSSKLPLFFSILGLLALAALGWKFLLPAPGLPMPPGAVEDQNNKFAIVPTAPGWASSATQQSKAGFIETLAFVRPDGAGPLRASLKVLVQPSSMPELEDSTAPQWRARAEEALAAEFDGFKPGSAQQAQVDKLKALKVSGVVRRSVELPPVYGDIQTLTADSAVPERNIVSSGTMVDYDYAVTAQMVSGKGRTYLVAALGAAADDAVLQSSLDSFRVTERPLAHAAQIDDVSQKAALGAAGLAGLMILAKIARRILS